MKMADCNVSFSNDCVIVNGENLEKSYKSTLRKSSYTVFANVNLKLVEGEIYGLLGPSGCGKTTLLKSIIGRQKVDKGKILVFDCVPGSEGSDVPGRNVGYMQQDVCVYTTLTIGESWSYYGGILGVPKEKLKRTCQYFIDFLRLPPENTLNAKLSGGQLRRVAFVASLLHEPRLLVLDEPTVGIDPITKKRMWDHLIYLARERRTCIILTTHYIEEARNVDKVGMMHGGTLAVQDSTANLLTTFCCTTLEEVFLKLCSSDRAHLKAQRVDGHVEENKVQPSSDIWTLHTEPGTMTTQASQRQENFERLATDSAHKSHHSCINKFRQFKVRKHVLGAIIFKNALHLFRVPGATICMLVMPIIMVSLGFTMFGEEFDDVKLNLVNEDIGDFGSIYVSFLDLTQLQLKNSSSLSEARQELIHGHTHGVIFIPHNFSEAYLQRITHFPLIGEEILNSGTIHVLIDPCDPVINHLIRTNVLDAFDLFQTDIYTLSGLDSNALQFFDMSAELKQYLGQPDSFTLVISLNTIGLFYVASIISILDLALENSKGHLENSFVAGVTSAEIVLGMFILELGIVFLVTVFVIISLSIFCPPVSWPYTIILFILLFFNGVVGILWGFFVTLLCHHIYIIIIVMGALLVLAGATSGSVVPYEAAPHWYQYLLKALPHTYPARAAILVMLSSRDFYPEVIYSFIIFFGWGSVFITLTLILLQRLKYQ